MTDKNKFNLNTGVYNNNMSKRLADNGNGCNKEKNGSDEENSGLINTVNGTVTVTDNKGTEENDVISKIYGKANFGKNVNVKSTEFKKYTFFEKRNRRINFAPIFEANRETLRIESEKIAKGETSIPLLFQPEKIEIFFGLKMRYVARVKWKHFKLLVAQGKLNVNKNHLKENPHYKRVLDLNALYDINDPICVEIIEKNGNDDRLKIDVGTKIENLQDFLYDKDMDFCALPVVERDELIKQGYVQAIFIPYTSIELSLKVDECAILANRK
jgi:hypothetical protein